MKILLFIFKPCQVWAINTRSCFLIQYWEYFSAEYFADDRFALQKSGITHATRIQTEEKIQNEAENETSFRYGSRRTVRHNNWTWFIRVWRIVSMTSLDVSKSAWLVITSATDRVPKIAHWRIIYRYKNHWVPFDKSLDHVLDKLMKEFSVMIFSESTFTEIFLTHFLSDTDGVFWFH